MLVLDYHVKKYRMDKNPMVLYSSAVIRNRESIKPEYSTGLGSLKL